MKTNQLSPPGPSGTSRDSDESLRQPVASEPPRVKLTDLKEPDRIAIAGDWHGNAAWARHSIEYAVDHGAHTLVHVGDFGFWRPRDSRTQRYLDAVSATVEHTGIDLLWLPGNHEYWPGLPGNAGRDKVPSYVNGNLVYLPIGYRWEWWGKKFMAVGGAFSIDRYLRTKGEGYWEEECLTPEDVDWCCHQPHGMDVVFSHDCPRGVTIPGIGPESKPRGGFEHWPPEMMLQAANHRILMREIWDKHRPQRWYHGHYHVPYQIYYGPTIFTGLDCDGASGGMADNITFLSPEDLK